MSSFDDGYCPDFNVDICDAKSRLRYEISEFLKNEHITYDEFCVIVGYDPATIDQNISYIEVDNGNNPVIQKLLCILDRSIGWLLVGTESETQSNGACDKIKRANKLAWEFIYRSKISHENGKRFITWLEKKLNNFSGTTKSIAYRSIIPRTIVEIAKEYEKYTKQL